MIGSYADKNNGVVYAPASKHEDTFFDFGFGLFSGNQPENGEQKEIL
jgi:hypothetical protein